MSLRAIETTYIPPTNARDGYVRARWLDRDPSVSIRVPWNDVFSPDENHARAASEFLARTPSGASGRVLFSGHGRDGKVFVLVPFDHVRAAVDRVASGSTLPVIDGTPVVPPSGLDRHGIAVGPRRVAP